MLAGWGRPGLVIVALAFGLALVNLTVTLHRSMIPVSVDGRITDMELRREKHPGVDDVHLLHVDGRRLHVDAAVAEALRPGLRMEKEVFSTTLETSRGQWPCARRGTSSACSS